MENKILDLSEKFIIYDMEWTAWPGSLERKWSGEGEYREIIEVGAIKVIRNGQEFQEIDRFEQFIKPQINSVLDQFLIDLTGITNEKIARDGVAFGSFLDSFVDWSGDLGLYSFSGSGIKLPGDLVVLIENCMIHKMHFPFNLGRFHNLYEVFHGHGYEIEQSGAALKAFGMEPHQRPHTGVNDALGLLDGLNELVKRVGEA